MGHRRRQRIGRRIAGPSSVDAEVQADLDLWNRAVDLMLREELAPYKRIWIETIPANHVSWRRLSDKTAELLDALETPLFGADVDGGAPWFRAATEQVL